MATARRVINILALTLVAVFLVIGLVVVAIIFWPTDWNFLGIGGVNVRHVWTRYESQEVADALAHRNLIIQSRHTNVEIRVRKDEQHDVMHERGTITLFENARGLTFNNIHRTHIGLTQILIDGEVFYKIRVTEPRGMVTRDSTVVINLVADPDYGPFPYYNIILDTGIGRVQFVSDLDAEHMAINRLTIMPSTVGLVTFPAVPTGAHRFDIGLNYLEVNSNNPSIRIPTGVRRHVNVRSTIGSITLGYVGNPTAPNVFPYDPRINVAESSNLAINVGNVFGNVRFHSTTGSLRVTGQTHGITGSLDMDTRTASLNATRIGGELNLISRSNSTASIGTVIGITTAEFRGAGSIGIMNTHAPAHVDSLRANVTIGGTTAVQGARSSVWVENRYGRTAVNFARTGLLYGYAPPLIITGFDGNISATRIVGVANIFVQSGGRAQITASFIQIATGLSRIEFMGATHATQNFGNVTITLLTIPINQGGPFHAFDLQVVGTARARDHTGWANRLGAGNTQHGVEIPNMTYQPIGNVTGTPWPVQTGDINRRLRVTTSNTMTLRTASA